MLRLSTPPPARLSGARGLDVRVGGAESNVAVALARLGDAAAWISCLPAGPLARRILEDLAAAGVDTTHVTLTDAGRVGLYFVEFGSPPRPTSVVYDRAGSAFSLFATFAPNALAGARFAVVSGITPALSPHCEVAALAFARAARAGGAGLVCDVNFRARLWSPDAARPVLATLLGEATIAVASSRDLEAVFAIPTADIGAAVTAFAQAHAPDAALVVVTLGADGAVARTRAGEIIEQAAYPAAVVDRLGAGDAFVAGLVHGLLADMEAAEALRFGCALAALKTTVFGDHSHFTATDVRAAIASAPELDR
jgi:2-dehydro-3-deoxygluconokinase